MLAAAIIVPGIALGYLAFTRVPWRRRIVNSALATSVLVVVSGAWIAAVQLTPAVDRPYVGSTSDNSALSLALGYNGLGRVTGQTGGTSTGGGGGGAFSGTPGWFRLINNALGDQGGWLLPLAILGGVSVLGALIVARDRRRLGTFAVIGGWFGAAAVVFSFSSGIIHTYYLSALAPATAALIGAGVVALWRDARAGGLRIGLPIAALALSGWLEVALLRRSGYDSWLQAVVVIGTAAAVVVLVGARGGCDPRGRSPPGGDGRDGPRGRGAVRGAGGLVVDRLQERRQRGVPRRRAELPVGRLGGRRGVGGVRRRHVRRGGATSAARRPGTRPTAAAASLPWRRDGRSSPAGGGSAPAAEPASAAAPTRRRRSRLR